MDCAPQQFGAAGQYKQCQHKVSACLLTAVIQLRHYDWSPPELWSRSAQVSVLNTFHSLWLPLYLLT